MKNHKIIVAIILCSTNLILATNIKVSPQQILITHIFLFSLDFASNVIQKKITKLKNSTPSHQLSVNFLRIFACVLFLLPSILNQDQPNPHYIYNFFGCYFFYIFYDIFFKHKTLNKINNN